MATAKMNFYFLSEKNWDSINKIEGWLSFSAASLTWLLVKELLRREVPGGLLEIGVYKAKYLSLIALAANASRRPIFGIDGFFEGFNRPLDDRWVQSARDTMLNNIASVATYDGKILIIKANSTELSPKNLAAILGDKICFASIDAGHEANEVYNDFRIVAECLAPGAIIAADDVFNAVVPGAAEGTCRFLSSGEGRHLAPFATCGNKVFITDREHHAEYLQFCKDVVLSGSSDHLAQTEGHYRANLSIGYAPRFFGHEVLPFV
jgi:hypothetical protein